MGRDLDLTPGAAAARLARFFRDGRPAERAGERRGAQAAFLGAIR